MLVAESARTSRAMTEGLLTLGSADHNEGALGRTSFEDVFRASIERGLARVLGLGGARAILYHLDLPSLDSPKKFHDKLTSIFGAGAPSLERMILQQLHEALGVRPASPLEDFVNQVERTRLAFDLTGKR
jgi:hypothetical protein